MAHDNPEREASGEFQMKVAESRPEYQKIARLAYVNATELLDEARLLLKEKKSPRAFALAVAAIEELMKSYLADTVWKQDLDPDTLVAELNGRKWKILKSHGSKQHLFALFLMMQAARQEGREKMESVDRILRETLTTDAIEVKGKGEIVKSITSMERNRQDSLYVGTKEERGVIKTPREVISQAMCEDLFAKIEAFLHIVETNLKLSKARYESEMAQMRKEAEGRHLQSVNREETSDG